ncbi:translocation/assembly module TamB [Vibrio sp. S4M6]|uniref:autotransporter assembly complex protein TamB n=1 Tax=Vibrio sinus TaxID=2946865 RepID=UPI00202A8374|nr:translocation/assembly module TamB domain-containing protein [Vibrio sinus]MCL9780499.1 translocation/assembly module TamB [Vibrio sinus]
MKLIIHSTKWLSYILAALVALMLAVTVGLLYTPVGLKLIVWGAEKTIPQLTIGASSGAIFPRFTLYDVSYKDTTLGVNSEISSVSLGLNPVCLMQPAVCIQGLSVDGANISLSQNSAAPTKPEKQNASSATSISLPISVSLNQLALANVNLNLYGDKVSIGKFSSQASWHGNQLSIGRTQISDVSLTMAPSPPSTNNQSATNKEKVSKISLPAIRLPVNVKVNSLSVNNFTLQQPQPLVINHFLFEGRAQGQDIDIKSMQVTSPIIDASLQGKIRLQGEYPLAARLTAKLKETEFAGQKVQLSLAGSVDNLELSSQWSSLIEGQLSGSLHPLVSNVPFDLKLSNASAQWPLRGKSDYRAYVKQLDVKGSLDKYHFDLNGMVDGGQIPKSSIDTTGSGSLQGLNFQTTRITTLGGNLDGKVSLDWHSLFTWQADLNLANIQPAKQWPDYQGTLNGNINTQGGLTSQGGWQMNFPNIDVQGSVRAQPFRLLGSASASDHQGNGNYAIETPNLVLSHGPNSITAQGDLGDHWNMHLAIKVPKLSQTLSGAKGQIEGTVRVSEALAKPKISLNLTANNIAWQDMLSLKQASLVGDVSPLSNYQGKVVLHSQKLDYQNTLIQSIAATLSGSLREQTLQLNVGSKRVSTNLTLTGGFKSSPSPVWHGRLNDMSLRSRFGTWLLNKPTNISYLFKQQQVELSPHCWVNGDSSLCLDSDAVIGKAGQAAVSIHDLSLHQVAGFLPEGVDFKGVANAKASIKWAPNQPPQLSLNLSMPNGSVIRQSPKRASIDWSSITLGLNLKDNQLKSNWDVQVKNNGTLSGHLNIPDVRKKNKRIDGKLKVTKLNLDFLAPLLGTYSKLGADVESDLSIRGDLKRPQVYGQTRLDNILVKGDISPVDVDSGKVEIEFSGQKSSLKGVIRTPEGEIQVSGGAQWRGLKDWKANAHVFANGLLVNVPPMAKLKVVPDLKIDVTPKLANITGNISLPSGEIVIEKLPPNAIKVSKDQVILNSNLQPESKMQAIPFKLQSDVKISIGNDVSISAFGLKGKLQGELHVTQNEKGPFVVGEVNILDGTYQSFGQDLQIQSGKVLMNGPIDKPYIDITAIRNPANTQDQVTAGIKVTGPADDPVVSIFSDPALPQAQALSYLLRGQNLDTQGGNSAMTTTLIGLSLAQSGKLVGQIGQAFGVQDLQLDTSGAGDTSQVNVSGYVLPHLQVKYGVGIFNQVGEFTVRYELLSNLYLEAVSGLDSAVNVLYQFEFN